MTAVVGLVDNGDVYIASDSCGVAGLSVTVRNDVKSFVNGPFVIGGTTSFRMLQLLRFKFSPPAQTVHQEDYEYMVTSFIDAARKCFVDNGFGNPSTGGSFLVGYRGNLYAIDSDFQVGIPAENYSAVGCGQDLCLGAMFANGHLPPQERLTNALSAASKFSGGVCAPFNIVKLDAEKEVKPVAKLVKKVVAKKKATVKTKK
jgi:ATP-dependent protease HslVU (ClpYQ) peptidase subunit